jgi:hypothetical protein
MAIDIEVATKDCTALTDGELAEMADLSAGDSIGWEVGFLSKQREEWVLVTQVREQAKLRGYALATLERIGGTPSLLIGVAAFTKGRSANAALGAVMHDLYRRAVLAFPDEDVLVGARLGHAQVSTTSCLAATTGLPVKSAPGAAASPSGSAPRVNSTIERSS